MFFGGLYLFLHYINSKNIIKILTSLSIFATIPLLFLLGDRLNFDLKSYSVIIIFIFLAQFLGGMWNFYKYIEWYDIFMHFLFGIVCTYFSFILLKFFDYDFSNYVFIFLFSIGFVSLCSLGWEILEFAIDTLFSANLQHTVESGINDTMGDIICSFCGSFMYGFFRLFLSNKKF